MFAGLFVSKFPQRVTTRSWWNCQGRSGIACWPMRLGSLPESKLLFRWELYITTRKGHHFTLLHTECSGCLTQHIGKTNMFSNISMFDPTLGNISESKSRAIKIRRIVQTIWLYKVENKGTDQWHRIVAEDLLDQIPPKHPCKTMANAQWKEQWPSCKLCLHINQRWNQAHQWFERWPNIFWTLELLGI